MGGSYGEEQQEEIKTIKPRLLSIKLSDADVKRIFEKAGSCGLTVGELLENFIGDLVDGTFSNGSDERMYAQEWFERCGFERQAEYTFLRYLLESTNGVQEAVDAWENIKASEKTVVDMKKSLASGVMQRNDKEYTWKDLLNGAGKPAYSCREEWEQEVRSGIQTEEAYIAGNREDIDGYWQDYLAQLTEYKPGSLEEEMRRVLVYWKEYQRVLGETH